jgi:hypothetical protein
MCHEQSEAFARQHWLELDLYIEVAFSKVGAGEDAVFTLLKVLNGLEVCATRLRRARPFPSAKRHMDLLRTL